MPSASGAATASCYRLTSTQCSPKIITFEDDGRMALHAALPPDTLERWSIDPAKRVEGFRQEQPEFLAHQRRLLAIKLA
jgi:hypothetical protein